ncbi:MAG: DedA family inner membrane protein YdjX, partial [uncultured Rubrobacteraceae bacterium]
ERGSRDRRSKDPNGEKEERRQARRHRPRPAGRRRDCKGYRTDGLHQPGQPRCSEGLDRRLRCDSSRRLRSRVCRSGGGVPARHASNPPLRTGLRGSLGHSVGLGRGHARGDPGPSGGEVRRSRTGRELEGGQQAGQEARRRGREARLEDAAHHAARSRIPLQPPELRIWSHQDQAGHLCTRHRNLHSAGRNRLFLRGRFPGDRPGRPHQDLCVPWGSGGVLRPDLPDPRLDPEEKPTAEFM